MALPKLTKLELQIMDALWSHGASSVREIQEAFPEKDRPAYTTVQTMVYRLEAKKAIRRVKKIGNAHIFEAVISRTAAQRRLIDELLSFFGGRTQPVMAHLIESGKLTLDDVQEGGADASEAREKGEGVMESMQSCCRSPLAIDDVRGSHRGAGLGIATEPRGSPLLAVARRVGQAAAAIRAAGLARQRSELANDRARIRCRLLANRRCGHADHGGAAAR